MSTSLPLAIDSLVQMVDPPPAFDVPQEGTSPVRRLSVAEYEQIIAAGILTEDNSVELLEGLKDEKITKNPRHDPMIYLLV